MDEAEWLACTDPKPMLEFLRGKVSDRKLRLFAVACCRRIWPLLTDERSRRGVEVAERYVDGLASEEEGAIASKEAGAAAAAACKIVSGTVSGGGVYAYPDHDIGWFAASEVAKVSDYGRFRTADVVAASAAEGTACASGTADAEAAIQVAFLHDIFGNPFRPITLDPAWRTPTVTALAQAAYEERHLPAGTLVPDRLAVLADALEDAGCDNTDILSHLRGPGPHVRGCWVIDLLLGKE
jgi:hypothetical protein